MPTDMADLAASIGRMAKQQNPEAYGEWDDAELGAQLLIQQQGQVHALFQSSNEKDPQGEAVVRPNEPPALPLSVQRILSGEPPLAASHPVAGAQEPDYGYGFRYNSRDPKGLGYLGTLKRPDRTGVMGEYSIGDEQGREIPSMVPTLTRKEVEQILALPEGASPSEAIKRKARDFAQQRRDAGLPVFARAGEQNTARYRDIPRDAPEARPQPPPMMQSHQTQQELNPPPKPSAWSKAQTIGAPGLGDRYVPPTTNEIMASDNPFRALLESVSSRVIGPGRPRSVAAADPYGIDAALEGKGHFPVFMGTVDEVGTGIRAYHGSPHDFDKFSVEKIGTGEGAQAFGHGLYFAESEPVAQSYRRKLASSNAVDARMDTLLQKHQGALDPALDEFMQSVYDTPKAKQKMRDSLAKQWTARPPIGRTYEVNINADPAQFLDWDAPISQQPAVVQELVAKRWAANDPTAPRTGAELYRELGPDAQFAADWLKERGVPGVKYLDHASRSTTGGELIDVFKGPEGWQSKIRINRANGEQYFTTSAPHATREAAETWAQQKIADPGTRNYVVHDDKLIEILRKYGLLPPLAAGAAASQFGPDSDAK